MTYYIRYSSPVGMLTLACGETGCIGLWMDGQRYDCATLPRDAVQADDHLVLSGVRSWLNRYFAGERPSVEELSLQPAGSDFQKIVWKCLCEIPYGTTVTYGELALKVAGMLGKRKMSAQAIGGAVGRNPISIIIPCHRVVGAKGALTGYSGGMDKKRQLLCHEGIEL